jgi:hypothetical protein
MSLVLGLSTGSMSNDGEWWVSEVLKVIEIGKDAIEMYEEVALRGVSSCDEEESNLQEDVCEEGESNRQEDVGL